MSNPTTKEFWMEMGHDGRKAWLLAAIQKRINRFSENYRLCMEEFGSKPQAEVWERSIRDLIARQHKISFGR